MMSMQKASMAPARRRARRTARRVALALTGLSIPLVTAGCHIPGSAYGAAPSPGTTITVGAVPGVDNGMLYLAQKDGLFNQAGLHVKIDDYKSVAQEITALYNNSINIAAGDYASFFYAQQQSNQPASQVPIYRIVADGYDAAPGVIEMVAMPNSAIKTPSDLAGIRDLKIGVPDTDLVAGVSLGAPVSIDVAAATSVLNSYGVNESSNPWHPMTPAQELSQLKSGKIQAAVLTEPYIQEAETQLGAVEVLDACSGAWAGLPLSGYFTTTSWYKGAGNDAAVSAFQSALSQAATDAQASGPIQGVLPQYANMTRQTAALMTLGTYPTSTNTANLQQVAVQLASAGLLGAMGFQFNVAKMIIH